MKRRLWYPMQRALRLFTGSFRTILPPVIVLLPWRIRRGLLVRMFGYDLHPTSRIGVSWVFPTEKLVLGEGASIGHLTVCHGLRRLEIGPHGRIGPLNWITGYRSGGSEKLFEEVKSRRSDLVIDEHAAITRRHFIDCTDAIKLGRFTTVAGCRSVLLTHSVDVASGRQTCAPISIGEYCFVGTNSVVLGGAVLPSCCVLGAMSLLNKRMEEPYRLYAGVPARAVKTLEPDAGYFTRTRGRAF